MNEREGTPPRRITPLAGTSVPVGARVRCPLDEFEIDQLAHEALFEDRAFEDVTTIATVLSDRHARARLVARSPGVIAGVPLAIAAFRMLDDKISIRVDCEDGARVAGGDTVLFLTGHTRALLSAERVALNFIQRLSGIATLTRKYVDAVAGTRAAILDTRKTTPGWRLLEKYAVRCGGGTNHRLDLASAILIKDNHLAALDGNIALAVRRCREHTPQGLSVQVECDRPHQVEAALAAGADAILLDNMDPSTIAQCVALVARRIPVEVSGGVTLGSVRALAECGVDRISVGALTHSAPALDLSLDFE